MNAAHYFYYYTALARATESDYRKLLRLKKDFGDWRTAWEAFPKGGLRFDPESCREELSRSGARLILLEDADYPPRLREIPHPPFGLYAIGALPAGSDPSVAIVGTRKATIEGAALAKKFSAALARSGASVISGLALGIDAAAHEGALSAGKTIAVLGNGIDRFYPRTNERLGKKILDSGGALVSEYPPGTPSLPYRFLERNRIVSGLSDGVLVIEAPRESGSLVTARFALEQNRDVFAVPGPVSHPNYAGSNQLIRAGAELVTSPEEIIETLWPGRVASEREEKFGPATAEEQTVLDAIEKIGGPASIDKVAEITNLECRLVSRAVSFLVLKNRVKETERGYTIS